MALIGYLLGSFLTRLPCQVAFYFWEGCSILDEKEPSAEGIEVAEEKGTGVGRVAKLVKSTNMIKTLIIYIIIMFVVYTLYNIFIFNAQIPSDSMENTINSGDMVFCLRYLGSTPQKGDIVVVNSRELNKYVVKRVIGVGGDKVKITDGDVYINDVKLDEPYLIGGTKTYDDDEYTYSIPDGNYFLLGDNREHSKDSRYWENPFISRNDIVAKAIFRYYPFDKMGAIS